MNADWWRRLWSNVDPYLADTRARSIERHNQALAALRRAVTVNDRPLTPADEHLDHPTVTITEPHELGEGGPWSFPDPDPGAQ